MMLAVGALWAVGCSPGERFAPPQLGSMAPDYAAPDLKGDTVSLSSLRGKVVLLNLWATWCAPCRHETPFLQEKYVELSDRGFEIVGISMDTRAAADQVERFVEEYGVTFTILHDPKMRGMELYQVFGLPATFLIDREGTLRWMRYGPVSEKDEGFLAAIEDALR